MHLKRGMLILLIACLFVSIAKADSFYYEVLEEIEYAITSPVYEPDEGYVREVWDDFQTEGVTVGFDLQSGVFFVIGNNSKGEVECSSWPCVSRTWNQFSVTNWYGVRDIMITDGIIDRIAEGEPFTFMYRYKTGDWIVETPHTEEDCFALNDRLHNR